MKRAAGVLSAVILMGILLTSCNQPTSEKETPTQSSDAASSQVESALPEPDPTPAESTAPSAAITYPDIDDLEFSDLAGMEFVFASGAGAWGTVVEFSSDGTFSGQHSDSDMGDTASDYPNGTCYECSFSGTFSSLTKIGDYEYSMKCESITQEGTPEEIVIKDGRRHITSTPYGFDDIDEMIVYLPGKKLQEMPEEFLQWVGAWDTDFDDGDVLSFYGLYNVAGKQGFY